MLRAALPSGTISNWTGLITLQQHIRKVRADSIHWGSSGPLDCRGHSWQLPMTLWWHQPFSMELSAGSAAPRQQVGRDWINLSRRPALSLDALLNQCRWWERAGWWTSCPHCWWWSPTPLQVTLHWAAPSAIDWYTSSVQLSDSTTSTAPSRPHCALHNKNSSHN